MIHPFEMVAEFERVVAEYAGSKYAVAVDSCTNAIFLSLKYIKAKTVGLPFYTYVGVPYAVINAGAVCTFTDYEWKGRYVLEGTNIVDSAKRFQKGMYIKDTLYCLSTHWGKHLKVGRGGFILTDDKNAADDLRIMRFDGRNGTTPMTEENFISKGYHAFMLPEEASRGLMLMRYMPDFNEDITWDDKTYPNLDKFEIFKTGYKD